MVEGYGPASRLMSFPVAIIVEGAPARLPAAAQMARTDARPTAAGGDGATRATSAPRAVASSRHIAKGLAVEP
jgi:hypothetical protein